jgi:hypothetical protein
MSNIPPSKREILERYRDKIAADDFELLVADAPPTPSEAHQQSERIDIIGEIGGWMVWMKKKLFGRDAGLLVVFVTLIGTFQACEWLHPKIVGSYDQISSYVSSYIPYDRHTPSYYVAFQPPNAPHHAEQQPADFLFSGTQVYPISGSHPIITGSV